MAKLQREKASKATMFYDLNVPYAAGDEASQSRTLNFMHELGYNVVALNHSISGKLPNELVSQPPTHSPLAPPTDNPRPAPSPLPSRSKTSHPHSPSSAA